MPHPTIPCPPPTRRPARLGAHLRRTLAGCPDPGERLELLCRSLATELGLAGATITLMGHGDQQGVVAASGPAAWAVDAVQFDVGEGPSRDAFVSGRPVLVPDLARAASRWPGLVSEGGVRGLGAVYAFPLRLGAVRLGVLTGYAVRPRTLGPVELTTITTYAEVGTELLTGDGSTADDGEQLAGSTRIRTEVYQAQGMVKVALGVGLDEALVRMRGAAFASGRTLDELALDVVARGGDLDDPDRGEPPEPPPDPQPDLQSDPDTDPDSDTDTALPEGQP